MRELVYNENMQGHKEAGAMPHICPKCGKVWQRAVDIAVNAICYFDDFPKYGLNEKLCFKCAGKVCKIIPASSR
jgi:hypothetical protein